MQQIDDHAGRPVGFSRPGSAAIATATVILALLLPTVASAATQTLSVEKAGTGTGTVVSSPAGINCGVTCSAPFEEGKTITLAGSPGANSGPVKWGGCDSVNAENRCLVTIGGEGRSVTATFDLAQRELKVTKAGTGTGTVTSSPAGIECGATCAATFGHGTVVTLSAAPGPNSLAAEWSGCAKIVEVGGEKQCEVTMTGAKAVTATFGLGKQLTVSKLGNGTGTVTSSPGGIQCGSTCAVGFAENTPVTLAGTPGLHTQAVKWSGCDTITLDNKCLLSMGAAREVIAVFSLEPQWVEYTVSVKAKGTGKGTIVSFPSGIECPGDCVQDYPFKTPVTLLATPAPGSVLDHWSISHCASSLACTTTVTSSRTITAFFTAVGNRTLTVSKAGTGQGTVTSTPAAIECGATCSAELDASTRVVLKAQPAQGSTFAGWSGEGCSGTAACRVRMNEARNVTATFTASPSSTASKCIVPRLKGKTLAKARAALTLANCSLGKVRRPKHAKPTRFLRVRFSSPSAGTVLAAGSRVNVKLGS